MNELFLLGILVIAFVLGGWLLALIFVFKMRGLRKELERQRDIGQHDADARMWRDVVRHADGDAEHADAAGLPLQRFAVLRLELDAVLAADDGEVERERHLNAKLSELAREVLRDNGIEQGDSTWLERRDAGWAMLEQQASESLGPAPWLEQPVATSHVGHSTALDLDLDLNLEAAADSPAPDNAEDRVAAIAPAGYEPDAHSDSASTALDASDTPSAHPVEPIDLTPAPPSALETALRTFSSWPKALLPFMAQNIGWFIGAFCFLAGSVFLVTYTSGFAKALAVCGVIYAYTLFSAWAGYSLRRKRPNLKVASLVLMSTGVLLVPLNFSAAARLMLVAGDSTPLWLVSALVAGLMLATFYVLTRIVAGVVDRMLQGAHPLLFLGLSAAQFVLPLVAKWPHWPVLAALHLVLSAVLGYALLRHAREWIRSVLVDRRQVAYYAAGSLVYAFLVSLVHLTWGAGDVVLPAGYLAPHLMLLSGALFYLDSHFKAHADQTPWLSRFTFAIYALSALALALSFEATVSRHITLGLGAVIYGIVVWRYLTLTPIYPLLACLGGLYLSAVVVPLPVQWHFLATLPAIVALHRLSIALGSRLSAQALRLRIDLGAFRIMMLLLVVSFGWTVFNVGPDLVTAISALVLAGALWWLLGRAPGPLFKQRSHGEDDAAVPEVFNLRDGPWLYTVAGALGLAVWLLPALTGFGVGVQRAFGLAVLGGLFSAIVVASRRWIVQPSPRQTETVSNSALLLAGGAVAVNALLLEGSALPLDIAGAIVVVCSAVCWAIALKLRVVALVYAALLLSGVAGLLMKLAWFPEPSAGSTVLTVALGTWALLIWLERRPHIRAGSHQAFDDVRVLWLLPGTYCGDARDMDTRTSDVEAQTAARPDTDGAVPHDEAPAHG